jgi:hypothetical protein
MYTSLFADDQVTVSNSEDELLISACKQNKSVDKHRMRFSKKKYIVKVYVLYLIAALGKGIIKSIEVNVR